jgi:pimeloyl-ACP methyl ester carboxylesterase
MATVSAALDDVTLDCLVEGPDGGPLALCLHGFPDTRATFRHLSPALAAAGFRVVAPAMRGYAPSSLSASGQYHISSLASDAVALEERFRGNGPSVIVGHDWGAPAVELVTKYAPERFRKSVTIAVPPAALFGSLFLNYDQLRASWYMFFFQSPLADVVVANDDLEFIARQWRDWSPGYDGDGDVDMVRAALGTPENLAAAIGYYRAMFSPPPSDGPLAAIAGAAQAAPSVPTLYLHGRTDGCLPASHVGDPLPYLAPGSRFEMIEGAGHFCHLEQPGRVNELIVGWLSD